MIRVLAFITLFTFSGLGYSADEGKPIPIPNVKAGDKWTYKVIYSGGREGVYETRVQSVGEGVISGLVVNKATGDEIDMEWTSEWNTRFNPYYRMVWDRPSCNFKFPLVIGSNWHCTSSIVARENEARRDPTERTLKVMGWESVVVPAGTFRALKLEQNGETRTARGIVNSVGWIWYVPEVKREVKSTTETRIPSGRVVGSTSQELLEFTISPEWVAQSESDRDGAYFDPASIRKDGDLVKVEILNSLPNNSSLRSLREYDCKNMRLRSITTSVFSEPMGGGKLRSNDKSNDPWEDIAPDSKLAPFLKLLCAK